MPQAFTLAAYGSLAIAKIAVTTAAAVKLGTGTSGLSLVGRKSISITNTGPNTLYVGSASTVTTGTGYPVAASGGTFSVELSDRIQLWGIVASADQTSPVDTRVVEVK